ncbi:hypothetical protein NPS01_37560 [Nocardioides psychrotolerans]|uniref:Predicted ATPase n=1 Tax=Nocardioides psychrotolerans TaxID=1005945 RepID=A0A1I3QGA3_9ACTN|nr:ATP-binding protein [Nocardioides psychrotolerans]GEP40093.1 hypothetical protein NPS01_37560 [Nocardioides psychrotolerans]SFJ33143.1 Predicted ATPase [Nocardioides psychrotolerans]
MVAELRELRLPAFKSVRDARVKIGPLTLIVGRNGSGKSNIIDGLAVLQALAGGSDLRDALDGGRNGPIVRGGSEGCAPIGTDSFTIGCTASKDGLTVSLDLEVQVRPTLQVVSEHLWSVRRAGQRRGDPYSYLKTDAPEADSGDIRARWENEKRGVNPPLAFRASQLLTSQVATRVPATSQAGRKVHSAAEVVLEALTGVFILDPVPHQMREYVPAKDSHLRRNAENLSATLERLMSDPGLGQEILRMTRQLSEAQVSDLSTVSSDLGDVMVTLEEQIGGSLRQVPARLMSDGTLRFLAIAAAMLDTPADGVAADAGRLLVIEELENGLHPSQAALLLSRLKATAAERRVQTLATTHSTAILDALSGEDHKAVIVSSRDDEGWSHVTRLTDFPDYFEVVGRHSLGDSAVEDQLRPGVEKPVSASSSLAFVLGRTR